MGKEDDPFLLGFGNSSGVNSLLNFRGVILKLKAILGGGFKHVLFSSLLGEMIQFDEHIFQMGWFNHQLVFDSQNRLFCCLKLRHVCWYTKIPWVWSPRGVDSKKASKCSTDIEGDRYTCGEEGYPYCWWFRNPANQLICSLSHYLQGLYIPAGFLPSTVVTYFWNLVDCSKAIGFLMKDVGSLGWPNHNIVTSRVLVHDTHLACQNLKLQLPPPNSAAPPPVGWYLYLGWFQHESQIHF